MRYAEASDRSRIRELWDICFGDAKEWTDWFFNTRFLPSRTLCFEEDGQIVADLQNYPYDYQIRGKVFSAYCLHGVATHPDYRRRGIMGEMLCRSMRDCRAEGVPMMFHSPARTNQYFRYFHLPTSHTCRYAVEMPPEGEALFLASGDEPKLLGDYKKFAARYSGMVERNAETFALRIADLHADGGMVLKTEGGYCLAYETDDEIGTIETIYENRETLLRIAQGLAIRAKGKRVVLTLPEGEGETNFERRESLVGETYNVLRILNPSAVLNALGASFSAKIGVIDRNLPENEKTYDCRGEASEEKPDIVIGIGELGQWLSGYCSLLELPFEGNRDAAMELDRTLPKIPCFTLETY